MSQYQSKITKFNSWSKEIPASLGFMVESIFGIMGSQSLLHKGALSVWLSEGSPVLIVVYSVVQLSLVSCSCEYCSSVLSFNLQ